MVKEITNQCRIYKLNNLEERTITETVEDDIENTPLSIKFIPVAVTLVSTALFNSLVYKLSNNLLYSTALAPLCGLSLGIASYAIIPYYRKLQR